MLPKRRFWMAERTFGIAFSKYFSKERRPNRILTLWKVLRKCDPKRSFGHPKSSFGAAVCHSSPFLDNLHFEHFVKSVNITPRLNYLTKSSKWRLSKKGDEWHTAGLGSINFARWLQTLWRTKSRAFRRWLRKIVACDDAMCWFSGMLWSFVTSLCSPNEDFRKPKNISDRRFEHFFK